MNRHFVCIQKRTGAALPVVHKPEQARSNSQNPPVHYYSSFVCHNGIIQFHRSIWNQARNIHLQERLYKLNKCCCMAVSSLNFHLWRDAILNNFHNVLHLCNRSIT